MQWHSWLKERWQLLKDETRFSRRQLIVLGALSVLMLAGGALSARESRPHQVVRTKPTKVTPAIAAKKARKTNKTVMVVHVSGAVARPGLYKLKSGARAADALDAAGGVTAEGNADALNLAALVKDGQKIFLPRRGEPVNGLDDGLTQNGEQARLNLNTASADQLDQLDGIGPVLAKRILDWRSRHGNFTGIGQLDQIEGIGPKKLSLIRNSVIVE